MTNSKEPGMGKSHPNATPHNQSFSGEIRLTPKKVTQLLGETRMAIAETYGISSRQHVYNILRGKCSHPRLLTDLHSELERIIRIRERMGIPI